MKYSQFFKISVIAFIAILIIIVKSPVETSAKSVNVTLPSFNVTINTEKISNDYREYPLIVYKGITYFPMTWNDSRYLGLTTHWTKNEGLAVNHTGELMIPKNYKPDLKKGKNSKAGTATIVNMPIKVNGKTIQNSKEPYPLLSFRDITYFPITWRFGVEEFGWGYEYTNKEGLKIDSVVGYGKKSLSYEKFKAVVVGKTTREELELFYGKPLEKYHDVPEHYAYTIGIYEIRTDTGSIQVKLDPIEPNSPNQVVVGKVNWNFAPSPLSSNGFPQVADFSNYAKLKVGMTYAEVSAILGGGGSLFSEDTGGSQYSWGRQENLTTFHSVTINFNKVNGQLILGEKMYRREDYRVGKDAYKEFSNAQVTLEKVQTLKELDTYEEVRAILGGDGYRASEEWLNDKMIEGTFVWVGENGQPLIRINFYSDAGKLVLTHVSIIEQQ